MKTKIVYPHIPNCFAEKMAKNGEAPTEWNLSEPPILVNCDKEGNIAHAEIIGSTETWYELHCGNIKCHAIKRINAIYISNLE